MSNSYPNLKFAIDKEFDQWTCKEFLTYNPKDMFSNSILKDYAKLGKFKEIMIGSEKISAFNEFIDQYYEDNLEELKTVVEKSEMEWQTIKTPFFKLVNSLLTAKNNTETEYTYTWSEGNYICAISIFNCNPRFINDKDFQAYYRHPDGIMYVCVHEMLHFAFYDYVEKNHNELFKSLGIDGMWKLSEIFNDVILKTPEFVKLTKVENPGIYAQTKEELEKYSKMWEESKSIDVFLKKYTE